MGGNSIGKYFTLTSFGESHGKAIGGVIDGCPAGIALDFDNIQEDLDRRKPGQSDIVTQRKEDDRVEFLSGIFKGKTLGTPIGFIIKNNDHKSQDYSEIENKFRPSHADFTYKSKYGIYDHRGGGRASARETATRIVAGAIAKQILRKIGVELKAFVSAVGDLKLSTCYNNLDLSLIENNSVRCPDLSLANKMIDRIKEVKKQGDTVGGEITGIAYGVPLGWGEPVFDKLHADLAKAMLSINAVKSFKYGFGGLDISAAKGSDVNDELINLQGKTKTNYSGGIQGGISNGNDIYFEIAFKPVATIIQAQNSIDADGNQVVVEGKGRHDACVVPRAVPIVEAMLAMTLVDHYFRSKLSSI